MKLFTLLTLNLLFFTIYKKTDLWFILESNKKKVIKTNSFDDL